MSTNSCSCCRSSVAAVRSDLEENRFSEEHVGVSSPASLSFSINDQTFLRFCLYFELPVFLCLRWSRASLSPGFSICKGHQTRTCKGDSSVFVGGGALAPSTLATLQHAERKSG